MPGAWEIEAQQSVLAAVLHVDTTTIAWAMGLRNLIIPGPVIGLAGMPYDHARNAACMRALEGGFKWLFFLDSDVIPPRDAILRLMRHNVPVISGVYHRRSKPVGLPVMIKNGQWYTPYPPSTVIEVDFVGAGCLLIRRDVLEQLPPCRPGHHWFDWRVDMKGILPDGECLSEDFSFNLHCRRALGIPTLVDTGVICKHVGYAEAQLGGFTYLEADAA